MMALLRIGITAVFLISLTSLTRGADEVTYHKQISRLINENCVSCHREKGAAPFALERYQDVVNHAPMIRDVVNRKVMPPWFAAPASSDHPSPWSNDLSLSQRERMQLIDWIENGMTEGDAADAPQPPKFADRWSIGTPDDIFRFDKPVAVKADGIMPYINVDVDTLLTEDKWVRAIEVLPGERSVVHHVLVFAIPPGMSERDARRNGIDYWALYVPGNSATVYPKGYARFLPKGSRLKFQMHYTPNGIATEDLTSVGVIYSDEPPEHEVRTMSIVEGRFAIPPHADRHELNAKYSLGADIEVLGYLPHAHLRGIACRYERISNDGSSADTLLDIPHYDFNWQLFYQYAEPKIFRRGETIRYTAWYDNSEDNPANPDPDAWVGWGQQTDDEMHIGYVEYTRLDEQPAATGQSERNDSESADLRRQRQLFASADRDDDKKVSRQESRILGGRTPASAQDKIFDRFDTNGDGYLDSSEFAKLYAKKLRK